MCEAHATYTYMIWQRQSWLMNRPTKTYLLSHKNITHTQYNKCSLCRTTTTRLCKLWYTHNVGSAQFVRSQILQTYTTTHLVLMYADRYHITKKDTHQAAAHGKKKYFSYKKSSRHGQQSSSRPGPGEENYESKKKKRGWVKKDKKK